MITLFVEELKLLIESENEPLCCLISSVISNFVLLLLCVLGKTRTDVVSKAKNICNQG